ncbi:MAG: baeRF12 domain-containing protein [Paracoccaceae bacterium]|uniref:baeRF12 domain-containing protein n=1 Tax=Seohaeicola saemankumensis TaxID=481181 RepID=UPI001E2F447D|nr:host attachment protein [Seohaeicola saemankumensis]
MPKNNSRTWALVMNGTRCRILRGIATAKDDALTELVLRSEFRNLRDIMSDKPGRSFTSMGGGRRSAMAYSSDPVTEDQREFIRQVISLLDSHRRAGEYDRLAVFAEHDILGHLRLMLPRTLRDRVICEVPKNLLQLSAADLRDAILQELNDDSSLS